MQGAKDNQPANSQQSAACPAVVAAACAGAAAQRPQPPALPAAATDVISATWPTEKHLQEAGTLAAVTNVQNEACDVCWIG